MVAQIKQLSSHAVAKLRSDVIVTSISQAIEEVVCNSLDAGAMEIKVCSFVCYVRALHP